MARSALAGCIYCFGRCGTVSLWFVAYPRRRQMARCLSSALLRVGRGGRPRLKRCPCAATRLCLLVKDIPPKTSTAELTVERPQIYYGELTGAPVVEGSLKALAGRAKDAFDAYLKGTGRQT